MGDGWRDVDGWPPSTSTPTDWYLHSDGRANSKYGDGSLSTEAIVERTEAVLDKRFARIMTVEGVKEGLLVSAK